MRGGFAALPLTRPAGHAPGLAGCGPHPGEQATVRPPIGAGECATVHVACRGPGGAPAPTPAGCPCAVCSGLNGMRGPCAAPPCPALGPCRLPSARAAFGLRLRLAAHRSLARARSLPCLSGAHPPVARGAAAPRRPRCAFRRLGPRLPRGGAVAAPLPGCAVACVGWPRLAWLRACLPPPPGARVGGSPRPRLFPSLLPPGGAAAAGPDKSGPFTASPPPRARRAWVPLRRGRKIKDYGGIDMGRPKVPHCRECEDLRKRSDNVWWHVEHETYTCSKMQKLIDGQAVRTSPKWCPMRLPRTDAKT